MSNVNIDCVICSEIVNNNRECKSCGALYCYTCIKQWVDRSGSCPHCRKTPLMLRDHHDDSSFLHNRFVEKLADDSEVECPNMCSQGKVKRSNLKDHVEKFCENIIKPCTMKKYGCKFEGNFNQLQNHGYECVYLKLEDVFQSYENTIENLKQKCANAQQGEEFKMKISTLEQTNEMLRLENDELKEKVRKLQKQQQQHSSAPQQSSSQNNVNNSSYQQAQSNDQRQHNSGNNYHNNQQHGNTYNYHQHQNQPHQQQFVFQQQPQYHSSSQTYSTTFSQQPPNNPNYSHPSSNNSSRSNTHDNDHYHKSTNKQNARRSSNKDNCKQQ
ncbi:hypothetical protein C9374_004169 [Naegleria lovaniensis]|uniref:RING-type domain-containing protein n=1 Tax=Naegleria lovaniensis TaxID=51637 RepID=A0AA88GS70_NAELO|nr:uncharacterized protein C9374_004169 [Naegleria lovaniensis]KAG2383498.1 hypothetical protein C9374_004169 [Naegleria lovaniensis]